jgi:hypothetical protein
MQVRNLLVIDVIPYTELSTCPYLIEMAAMHASGCMPTVKSHLPVIGLTVSSHVSEACVYAYHRRIL